MERFSEIDLRSMTNEPHGASGQLDLDLTQYARDDFEHSHAGPDFEITWLVMGRPSNRRAAMVGLWR